MEVDFTLTAAGLMAYLAKLIVTCAAY